MSANTELIPPSMFQSTRPPDPWKDLAKVSEEVLELRRETEKLRNIEHKEPTVSRVQPELCNRRHPGSDEFKYANELISHQANELSELKSEIRRQTQKHEEEIRLFEKELTEKERDYKMRITSLENMLSHKEETYDQQVDRLSYEHQQITERLTDKITTLSDELEETKQKNRICIKDLTEKLKLVEEEKSLTTNQLYNNLREKESTVDNLSKQIQQLKSYIGESEKAHRPTQVWRKENETLSNKLQISEAEQDNLRSKNELINIRLKAMSDILGVQEAEISKSKLDINDKKKLEIVMLTRWREKVFALMVQNKSFEIYSKKCDEDWKNKYHDLQDEFTSAKHEIEVLKYQISEKTAQVDLEKINTKNVLDELSMTQQVAVCLDNQITENSSQFEVLKSVAESIDNKLAATMKKISMSISVLKSHGDRVSFASGRVELLQGQFARKEALRKLESNSEPLTNISNNISESHIVEELERVTRERDYITGQLKQVSELLNDKLADAKHQYEDEITTLKQSVEDLEFSLQQKSKSCENLSERLEEQDIEVEDMKERLDTLTKEIGRQKTFSEEEQQNQKDREEGKWREDVIEMEKQVNQARREQAKAVIMLRQLEKQSSREKERLNEHIKLIETHYNKQIEKLSEQQQTVEKERNMMMATLRQEGLMSKLKQDRREPIILGSDDISQTEEPIKLQENEPIVSLETEQLMAQPENRTEAMDDVIEDLKSLAAIVDDVTDSDDSLP